MIVFITTADTDIFTASYAVSGLPEDFPKVHAANPSSLVTKEARDELLNISAQAGVVVLRLLGGKRALQDAFDPLVRLCRSRGIPLIACPGHQEWDDDMVSACSVPASQVEAVFSYLMNGGIQNYRNLFLFLSDTYLGSSYGYESSVPLPWEGIHHPDASPGIDVNEFIRQRFIPGRPNIGVLFYRAHWMSGNLEFIDALVHKLEEHGANVLPVFCYSLKHSPEQDRQVPSNSGHGAAPRALTEFMVGPDGALRVDCIISTMSFSMGELSQDGPTIAAGWSVDYLDDLDVPIIQGIVSTGSREQWESSSLGLSPIDTAMSVAMPEFDGRIISVPVSFKKESSPDSRLAAPVQHYVAHPDRVDHLARLAIKWAKLRLKPNSEKKIAIILSNYPTKDARIGNAVGLDTPASVVNILRALKGAGYHVADIPEDGDALVHGIIERCSNDRDSLTEEQLRLAVGHVTQGQYRDWFNGFSARVQDELREAWGDPPGQVYRTGDSLAIAGLQMGNVFVGLQPPRGFGENPISIYHSPDLAPTHHYLAYYHWIRDVFQADAMIHVGKHGTLEWLPGKGIGLSSSCYPEVALGDLPLLYPFIINNPGEGTQSKRRSHATVIDHLIPAMTTADSYGDIAKLEQLMDEHYQCQTLDPEKLPILEAQIWQLVQEAQLHRDLDAEAHPENFSRFLLEVDGYICELKDSQIKDGLHTLGQVPQGDQLLGLLNALTRLDIPPAVPSLRRAFAEALGLEYRQLMADMSLSVDGNVPSILQELDSSSMVRCHGDVVERLETLCRGAYAELMTRGFNPEEVPDVVATILGKPDPAVEQVLTYAAGFIYPALMRTTDEISNLLRGLDGKFVPPGPSGAPTRGMANVLPTGRNFYSVDPNSIPSPAAWEVGKALAEALLEKYLREEGNYPESVGIVVWGTSAMRTHGDDIAQILYLMGVRPIWQQESRRVQGVEVIPLSELGRPRIDVTVRISGFFRDAFPNLIHLLDQAVETVAGLEESPERNYLIKHLREDEALTPAFGHPSSSERGDGGEGMEQPPPSRSSLYRIFGSKPGTYGAGILPLLQTRNWETTQDLAEVYTTWGGYAYTRRDFGVDARQEFKRRFSQIVVAAKNQDNREHDVFDSDDYLQYHGGMIATVRALTDKNPRQFFGDSSDPSRARVRDLADEARRVFRTRVVNPKWIDSMKRHGYKGAFEMAATVDYMFGYDATAQVVEDWMYNKVTEQYVFDEDTQEFFRQSNPWALRSIVERLLEAIERGLWEEPTQDMREKLEQLYLQLEADLEARQEGSS